MMMVAPGGFTSRMSLQRVVILLLLLLQLVTLLDRPSTTVSAVVIGEDFNEFAAGLEDVEVGMSEDGDPQLRILGKTKEVIAERLLDLINAKANEMEDNGEGDDISQEEVLRRIMTNDLSSLLTKAKAAGTPAVILDEELGGMHFPAESLLGGDPKVVYAKRPQGSGSSDLTHETSAAAADSMVQPVSPRRQLAPADFTTINNYWATTTYGESPGPCPSATDFCQGFACNLQGYMLDMLVLGEPLRNWVVEQARPCTTGTPSTHCVGEARVFRLKCERIQVGDMILLYDTARSSASKATVRFDILNLKLGCRGKLKFFKLGLDILKADSNGYRNNDGLTFACLGARNPINSEDLDIIIGNPANLRDFGSYGNGITLKTMTEWVPATGSFATELPFLINFVDHVDGGNDNDGGCRADSFDFPLSVTGKILLETGYLDWFTCKWQSSSLTLRAVGSSCGLTDWECMIMRAIQPTLMGLIRAILAGIVCDVVKQLAWVKNAQGQTVRGGINLWIHNIYTTLNGYLNTDATNPKARAYFLQQQTKMTTVPFTVPITEKGVVVRNIPVVVDKNKLLDFATSNLFRQVSLALNSVLGSESDSPNYIGRLTVNELIDIAMDRTDGILDLGDVKTKLELSEYPYTEFTGPVFGGKIELRELRLEGLNSFTEFNFLDNGYGEPPWPAQDRYKYTFFNRIAMQNFYFRGKFGLSLYDGYWVTNRPQAKIERLQYTFTATMNLNGLAGNMAVLSGFLPDKFEAIQLGGLLGDIDKNVDRLRCFATSLDYLAITQLRLSLNNLITMQLAQFTGLEVIFNNAVIIFNALYQSALRRYLPSITDHWASREFNEYLAEKVFNANVPTYRRCLSYTGNPVTGWAYWHRTPTPNTDPNRFLNFETSNTFEAVEGIVSRVIGGNPVVISSGDINRFVDMYMVKNFVEDPKPNSPNVLRKLDYGSWAIDKLDGKTSWDLSVNEHRIVVNEFRLVNTHSIHVLELHDVGPHTFTVAAKIGGGKLLDRTNPNAPTYEYRGPLRVSFVIDAFVKAVKKGDTAPSIMADDKVRVNLDLHNITIDTSIMARINQNDFLELTIGNLANFDLPCFLAIVDAKNMNSLTIGFANFNVNLDILRASATSLGSAIAGFAAEAPTWGPNVPAMVQYFFRGVADDVREGFNSFTAINGAVAGCATRDSPFANSETLQMFRFIDQAINFTKLYEEFSEDVPNPRTTKTATQIEQNVMFDTHYFPVTTDSRVQEVADAVSNPGTVKDALRSLADFDILDFTKDWNLTSLCGVDGEKWCGVALNLTQGLFVNTTTNSVQINANLVELGVPSYSSSDYFPDFSFVPGRLFVSNLDRIASVNLMRRFQDSKFTFMHDILWDKDVMLQLEFDFSIYVNSEFMGRKNGLGQYYILRQDLHFVVEVEALDLQMMTLTAVSAKEFDELTLNATMDCIMDIFYYNGLQIPQIWINATSINGPKLTLPNGNVIFTKAVSDLISALASIALTVFRNDMPDFSQGVLATAINDGLHKFQHGLRDSREIPCQPTLPQGPPEYFDFMTERSAEVLRIFHNLVAGEPVKAGALGLNSLIDRLMVYLEGKGNLPLNLTKSGDDWTAAKVWLLDNDDQSNLIEFRNLVIKGLDSIHVLNIVPTDSHTVDLYMKIGEGRIYSKTDAMHILKPRLQVDFDAEVKVRDPTAVAHSTFHFHLAFANLTINSSITADLNKKEIYSLRIRQLRQHARCALSIVDFTNMNELELGFADIELQVLSPVNLLGSPSKLNNALTQLQSESATLDSQDKHLLHNILAVVGEEVMRIFNAVWPLLLNAPLPATQTSSPVTPTKYPTVAAGQPSFAPTTPSRSPTKYPSKFPTAPTKTPTHFPVSTSIPTRAPTAALAQCDAASAWPTFSELAKAAGYEMIAGSGNGPARTPSEWYGNLTKPVSNPRLPLPGVSYQTLESAIVISSGRPFCIASNPIVREVSDVISSVDFLQDTLKQLADTDFEEIKTSMNLDPVADIWMIRALDVAEGLTREPGDSVSLRVNLATFGFPDLETNRYGPMIRIIPEEFSVTNLDKLGHVDLLKQYQTSNLTMYHQLTWNQPLTVSAQFSIETEADFVTPGGVGMVEDTFQMQFVLQGLDVQAMTTIALDSLKFDELGWFADLDCLLDLFYDNGLALPQLLLSVSSITGLSVGVTPPRDIVSQGVVSLVEAITEIIIIQVEGYLPNASNGEIRENLNVKLQKKIDEARVNNALTPCVPGNPYSMHYVDFTDAAVEKGIKAAEGQLGGDPVGTGQTVNFVVDRALQEAVKNNPDLVRVSEGVYKIPSLVDIYKAGELTFRVSDVTLKGLNSIHVFTIDVVDHHTLDVKLKIGAGKLYDKLDAIYTVLDPIRIGASVVAMYDSPGSAGVMADEAFTFEASISNFTIDTTVIADVSVDDIMMLRFKQQRDNITCLLAVVDYAEITYLNLGLVDLAVTQWTFTKNTNTDFGSALLEIKTESETFSPDNIHFFNNLLKVVSGEIQKGFNNASGVIVNQDLASCSQTDPPSMSTILTAAGWGFLASGGGGAVSNMTALYNKLTTVQADPRGTTAAALEAGYASYVAPNYRPFKIAKDDNVALLAETISDVEFIQDIMRQAANFDFKKLKQDLDLSGNTDLSFQTIYRIEQALDLADALVVDGNKVHLEIPLSFFGIPTVSGEPYVNGFLFAPGILAISNIHDISSVNLLQPLSPTADYTLKNTISWSNSLSVHAEIEIEMLQSFYQAGGPDVPSTDTWTLDLSLEGLTVELWMLVVADMKRLEELGFFATPSCFMNILLDNQLKPAEHGFNVPTFWTTMTQVIGPVFATTGGVFSDGFDNLVSATAAIIADIVNTNIPNMSQGVFRDKLNSLVNDKVASSRSSVCTPGNPYSIHMLNFTMPVVESAIEFGESVLGGDPVGTGSLTINPVLDEVITRMINNTLIVKVSPGTYSLPSLFELGEAGDELRFAVRDVTLGNLNSTHVFTIDVVDHHTLDVFIKIGGGSLYDKVNAVYQVLPQLKIGATIDFTYDPEGPDTPLALDSFRAEASVLNFTIDTRVMADINIDDLMVLRFKQLRKDRACALSIVDDARIERLSLGLVYFSVPQWTYLIPPSNTDFSDALDVLRLEAADPFDIHNTHLLNNILTVFASEGLKGFNNVTDLLFDRDVNTCSAQSMPTRNELLEEAGWGFLASNSNSSGTLSNLTTLYKNLTANQDDPRNRPATSVEAGYYSYPAPNYFHIAKSYLVGNISDAISDPSFMAASMREVANYDFVTLKAELDLPSTSLSPATVANLEFALDVLEHLVLVGEAVHLYLPLSVLGVKTFSAAPYIDGLRLIPGNFTVFNIEQVSTFSLLKPQRPDSYFTLNHTIAYPTSFDMRLEFTVEMKESFYKFGGSEAITTETWRVDFSLQNLVIEVWTLIVVNMDEFNELGLFASLDCFLNTIAPSTTKPAEYGLLIPTIWVTSTDITGPTLTIPDTILSDGLVGVITAIADIVADIIRRNLQDMTHGYLRKLANDSIQKKLREAAVTPPCVPGNEKYPSWLDFTSESVKSVIRILETQVGGEPVPAGGISINTLIDEGLKLTFVQDLLPFEMTRLAKGTWVIPQPIPPIDGSDGNKFIVRDLTLDGLDTVNKLTFDVVDSTTMAIELELGGGVVYDKLIPGNVVNDPLVIEVTMETVVEYPVASKTNEVFKLRLTLNDFFVYPNLSANVSIDDAMMLRFKEWKKAACALSIVDSTHMNSLKIGVFDIAASIIPVSHIPSDFHTAVVALKSELDSGVISTNDQWKMNSILNAVGGYIAFAYNNASHLFINKPVDSCMSAPSVTRAELLEAVGLDFLIRNTSAASKNFTELYEEFTKDQVNPRGSPGVSAAEMESLVYAANPSSSYYISNSTILKNIGERISTPDVFKDVLRAVANADIESMIADFDVEKFFSYPYSKYVRYIAKVVHALKVEADDTISLDLQLSELDIPELVVSRTEFVPGVRITAKSLYVTHLENVDLFQVLVPVPDGRFLFQHTIEWASSPPIWIDVHSFLDVDEDFLLPGGDPEKPVRDDWNISFGIPDLAVHITSLTAIDKDLWEDVGLVTSVNCFLSTFLDDGLSFPELWISMSPAVKAGSVVKTGKNLISAGLELLISSFADIVLAVVQDNLHDMTQGVIREKVNMKLEEAVQNNRGADCEVNPFEGDEKETYLNFTSPLFLRIVDTFNSVIAGDPVPSGTFAINNILDEILNILRNSSSVDFVHLSPGHWQVENLYTVVDDFDVGGNLIEVRDFRINNLDTIHVFTLEVVDHNSIIFYLKIGDGKLWDREALQFLNVPQLNFSMLMEVVIQKPLPIRANELVKWTVSFSNLTIFGNMSIDINMDELLQLKFTQLKKSHCLLSVVDDVSMEEFELGFADVDVDLDILRSSGTAMNSAFQTIKSEVSPTLNEPPKVMLGRIFEGLSKDVLLVFNNISKSFINDELEGCETSVGATDGNLLADVLLVLYRFSSGSTFDLAGFWANLTEDQGPNPKSSLDVTAIHSKVQFTNPGEPFDVNANSLVKEIRRVVGGVEFWDSVMQNLAKNDWMAMYNEVGNWDALVGTDNVKSVEAAARFLDSFEKQPDDSISIIYNMEDMVTPLSLFPVERYLPGFNFTLNALRVDNVNRVQAFEFLQPFMSSPYMTEYHVKFGSGANSLKARVGGKLTLAETTLDRNAAAGVERTDQWEIEVTFDELELEVVLLTALDELLLNGTPLGQLLKFDDKQCMLRCFYRNGLSFEHFWLQAGDVTGLSFSAQETIFTPGMAQLISSVVDIAGALVMDNMQDMSNGVLRRFLNGKLTKDVYDARVRMACDAMTAWPGTHLDWMSPNVFSALEFFHDKIAGAPVKTNSILGLNEIIDKVLTYVHSTIPDSTVVKEAKGHWRLPDVFTYQADIGRIDFSIFNATIQYLDDFHEFTITPYNSDGFDLVSVLGGGALLDMESKSLQPMPNLTISVGFDLNVTTTELGIGERQLASDRVEVRFLLTNGTLHLPVHVAKINMNDVKRLRLTQVTSTNCIFAVVDDLEIPPSAKVTLTFDALDVELTILRSSGATKFGDAFATLQGELPMGEKPQNMVRYFLKGTAESLRDGINNFRGVDNPLEDCEIPFTQYAIVEGVATQEHANIVADYVRWNVPDIVIPTVSVFQEHSTKAWRLEFQHPILESGDEYQIDDLFITVRDVAAASRVDGTPSVRVIVERLGKCATSPLAGTPFESICNWAVENQGNVSQKLQNWLAPQVNLIDLGVPWDIIEANVEATDEDTFYNVQDSSIVAGVSNFFKRHKGRVDGLLLDLVNRTDFLEQEPDGSISLVINVTQLFEIIDEKILNRDGGKCFDPEKGVGKPKFLFGDLTKSPHFMPQVRFEFGSLKFKRFGDLTDVMLLEPYQEARFTTIHKLAWEGVTLEVDFDFAMIADENIINPDVAGVNIREDLHLNFKIVNPVIQAMTLLAIDTTHLGRLSLGDFMDVDHDQVFTQRCEAFTCILTAIYNGGLQIPQFMINVTDIHGPSFTGSNTLFSEGVLKLLDAVIEIVVQVFKNDLPNITQGELRRRMNTQLQSMLYEAKLPGACKSKTNYTLEYPADKSRFVFRGNGQLERLKEYIKTDLLNPDKPVFINNFIRAVIGDVETKLHEFKGVPIKYQGAEFGTMDLSVGRFVLRGLDNVDHLQVFDWAPFAPGGADYVPTPEELEGGRRQLQLQVDDKGRSDKHPTMYELPYMTRSAIGIGGLPNAEPLEFGFDLSFKLTGLFLPRDDNPTGVVQNSLRITISIQDLDVLVDLLMLINIPRLMDLEIQSIATIYQLPCILTIFEPEGLIPTRFNVSYGEVGFKLECLDVCNSPFFAPLMDQDFDTDTNSKMTKSFTKAWNDITNLLIDYIASTDAQSYLAKQIDRSTENCMAVRLKLTLPPVESPSEVNAALYMGIVGLSAAFCALCGFAALIPLHFRRRDQMMKKELMEGALTRGQIKSKDEFDLAERKLMSPAVHPGVKSFVKILVPAMILVNIILFVTANFFAMGATVDIVITIGGDKTKPLTVLPFTLESSIDDMWNAGVYPLALIIAIASGGWPYVKNLLLIFTWFAPTTILGNEKRLYYLELLDILGKWSLVDMFVLIMLQVAFRFYLSSSLVQQFSSLPPDLIALELSVTPGWGMYGFLFGAMGSLLVNHIMIYYHKKSVRADEDLADAIAGTLVTDLRTPRIPMWRHKFSVSDADGRFYRYSVMSRTIAAALLVLSFLLVLISSVLPLMSFEFQGVAGMAIALINSSLQRQTYSAVSIGTTLLSSAPDDIGVMLGIILIEVLYLLFSFLIPLVLLIAMGLLWVMPLTLREQHKLFMACTILVCWDSLAVLVLSVVAAVLQISQLAQFIVQNASGNVCSALTAPLEMLFPNDPAAAQCFNVIAVLEPTAYLFIVAAVFSMFTHAVVFRLMEAALNDRDSAMRRHMPALPGEMKGFSGFLVRRSLEAFGAANAAGMNNMLSAKGGARDLTPSVAYGVEPGFNGEYSMSAYTGGAGAGYGAFPTPSMEMSQEAKPDIASPPVIAPRGLRVAPTSNIDV